MKHTFIPLIILFAGSTLFSQTVVLERSVNMPDTSAIVTVDVNKASWPSDLKVGIPYALGDEGADTRFWGTYYIEYGTEFNYRATDLFSFGGSLGVLFNGYRLKQNEAKQVIDTISHDKESINLNGINASLYLRLTYARGIPGKYVEIGAREAYLFGRSYTTWDRLNETDVETTMHKPDFLEPLQTFGYISLGFNGIGIFATYRITDLFGPDYNLPEMNRLTAGIEFIIG